MQTRARLYEMEQFGDENQFNKAVFLDMDTMDKVSAMVSDVEVKALAPLVGKDGVLVIALKAKGYDYAVKLKSFKVAA
jgi:hypothetical protein